MKALNLCCCCLLKTSDKDLKTPYNRLGITEIFSEIFEECFRIQLALDSNKEHGICSVCVGRLRDASDFKQQVQRSQAELRARLEGTLQVKDETGGGEVKFEVFEDEATTKLFYDQHYTPTSNHNETTTASEKPTLVKAEKSNIAIGHEHFQTIPGHGIGPLSPLTNCRIPDTPDHEPTSTAAYEHDEKIETNTEDKSRIIDHKMKSFRLECNEDTNKNNSTHRIHEDKNKYLCDICDKQFQKKLCLANHMRLHTRATVRKLFSCGICEKKFVKKSCLSAHVITHTGVKPFTCEECNKTFTLKTNLTKHRKLHTGLKPFACDICGTQYLRKYSLMLHIRVHTGQKPYSCDICNKSFTNISPLLRHKRTHTGLKPFSCEECNKRFTRKDHLKQHKMHRCYFKS